MSKKLILFSTTRQYNPGDEFIHFGVMNLLKSVGIEHSPVIYNRNQEINQPLSFLNPLRKIRSQSKWIKVLGSFLRISQVDNSFKDIHELDNYDMVVFAGSPEWASARLNDLYKKLVNFDRPILYMGLGSFGDNITISEKKLEVINKSRLITYRNEELSKFFSQFERALHMPCPALFSVKTFEHSLKKGKIAIVFGVSNASKGNHVSNMAMQKMITAFNHLSKRGFEVEIVCHYIDEVDMAYKIFPKANVHYSYDASDYENIYKEFEYVITSRVHAIGICASLSIPGTLIAHDGRASTVKGFLCEIIQDDEHEAIFLEAIMNRLDNTEQLSKQLKAHKLTYFDDYKKLLTEALSS